MSLPTSFPLNVALAFLAALASYYLVERPSPRLRQRIERALFPGGVLEAAGQDGVADRAAFMEDLDSRVTVQHTRARLGATRA